MSFGQRVAIPAGPGDDVGCAVTISDTTGAIYIGACGYCQVSWRCTGAVHRVDENGAVDTLVASSSSDLARFGSALAIGTLPSFAGDVIVIGAPGESFNGALGTGAAYVFGAILAEGSPTYARQLIPSSAADASRMQGNFGHAVAIHNGRVVVGARGEDGDLQHGATTPERGGFAYLFDAATGVQCTAGVWC